MTCAVPGSRFNDSHWSNTAGAPGQRAGHGRPVGPGLAAKQADAVRNSALPWNPHRALVALVMPTASFLRALGCAAVRVSQLCRLHMLPPVVDRKAVISYCMGNLEPKVRKQPNPCCSGCADGGWNTVQEI